MAPILAKVLVILNASQLKRFVPVGLAILLVLVAPMAPAIGRGAAVISGTWQVVAPHRVTPLFNQNTGIAVDSKHNVYVSDDSQRRVVRFSPQGTVTARWGTDTPGPLHWSPRGVAVDSSDNVYVLGAAITKVSPSGQYLTRWKADQAQAIAVGGAGNVFTVSTEATPVQRTSSGRIDKYSSVGTLVSSWHTPQIPADSTHQVQANGIAVDPNGNVFVTVATADNSGRQGPLRTSYLYRFSSSGTLTGAIRSSQVPLGPVEAADRLGSMYLAMTDYGSNGIEKLSSSGSLAAHWQPGALARSGANIHLALDTQDHIYVADSNTDGIQPGYASTGLVLVLSTSGKLSAQWGKVVKSPALPLGLAITVGANGTVYTTADDQHVFVSISSDGRVIRTQGRLSNKPPVIYYSPSAIAIGGRGNVYITDSVGGNVDKLSPGGRLLNQWRIAGINQGPVQGLAVDKFGSAYVVVASSILKLSPSGTVLTRFGSSGSGPGQFSAPYNLTLDARGNIFVADTHNDRIQELSPSGKALASWSAPGQLESPLAVAVGGSGHVFALDPIHADVIEFSPGGAMLATWGVPGSLTGQLNNPTGLAMDQAGSLYVLDYGNNRVQKLVRK